MDPDYIEEFLMYHETYFFHIQDIFDANYYPENHGLPIKKLLVNSIYSSLYFDHNKPSYDYYEYYLSKNIVELKDSIYNIGHQDVFEYFQLKYNIGYKTSNK